MDDVEVVVDDVEVVVVVVSLVVVVLPKVVETGGGLVVRGVDVIALVVLP